MSEQSQHQIMLVNAAHAQPFRIIVACVDFSETSREAVAQAWRGGTSADVNSTKPFPSSVGRQILALVGWVLLCFCAAAMGGLFLPGEWYASLKKPSWNPPGWIFGPMMAGPRGWSGDAAVDSAGL